MHLWNFNIQLDIQHVIEIKQFRKIYKPKTVDLVIIHDSWSLRPWNWIGLLSLLMLLPLTSFLEGIYI